MSVICDNSIFNSLVKGVKKITLKGNIEFIAEKSNLNTSFITKGFLYSFNIPADVREELKFSLNAEDPVLSKTDDLKNGAVKIESDKGSTEMINISDENKKIKIAARNFNHVYENVMKCRKRFYILKENASFLNFNFDIKSLYNKLKTISRSSKIKFEKEEIRLYSSESLNRFIDVGFEYEGGGEYLESFPVRNKSGITVDLKLPFRYISNFLDIFETYDNAGNMCISYIKNKETSGYIMDLSVSSPVDLFNLNPKKSFLMCFIPDNFPIVY